MGLNLSISYYFTRVVNNIVYLKEKCKLRLRIYVDPEASKIVMNLLFLQPLSEMSIIGISIQKSFTLFLLEFSEPIA